MSPEGSSYQLLKACHANEQQFLNPLQPTGGQLPTNEGEVAGWGPTGPALSADRRPLAFVVLGSRCRVGAELKGLLRIGAAAPLPTRNVSTPTMFLVQKHLLVHINAG